MESLRRPAVLAAFAAGLLVLNVVLLLDDDGPDVAVEALDDDGTDPAEDEVDGTEPSDDPAAADDTTASDEPATTDPALDDDTSGDDADEPDPPAADDGIAAPTAGTYTYASSGSWSLASGAEADEYELPATATAVVTGGDEWTVRLVAGDRYADAFTFVLAPDSGLDWTDWVLERTAPGLAGETAYACSGDAAFYRPDEQGRVAQHVCTAGSVTSTGSVEHLGTEQVTLGDGSVITADRLLYAYTVSGPGVSGDGQLDLWLDPATGLRVQERRSIATTSTSGDQQFEYREDVAFTLQSLTPN